MKKACFSFVGSLLFLVLVFSPYVGAPARAIKITPAYHSGRTVGMPMGLPADVGNDPMTNSLKNLSGKDFEITFMQYMMVHHQAAIQMAQLVSTHTKRPQLQTLAQNIIRGQSSEIPKMSTWLMQWYGAKPVSDPMTIPGMREMMQSMERLKALHDATFDQQFLTMMSQHHQTAINMASLLPGKTQRPELLQLGQTIIQAQGAEIQHMQTWQKEWFDS